MSSAPYDIPERWKRYEDDGNDDNTKTGRRHVPAALAGLEMMGGPPRSGFRDFPHRFDYHPDDEEMLEAENSQVVEFAERGYEDRGVASNMEDAHENEEATSRTKWSSRYQVDNSLLYLQQTSVLSNQGGTHESFYPPASSHRRSLTERFSSWIAWSGEGSIFGNKFSSRITNETNLNTAWKDIDLNEDDDMYVPEGPRTHKTWQQAMLAKKRRRRTLWASVFTAMCILAIALISTRLTSSSRGNPSASLDDAQGVTFYVTANTPLTREDDKALKASLQDLPEDADLLVHLGNVQDAATTDCAVEGYNHALEILQQSPVPVFVLPGTQDWLRCPDPAEALGTWVDHFASMEDYFSHEGMVVHRQDQHVENFSTLYHGVLFFGLHLTHGSSRTQWEEDTLKFFFGILNLYDSEYRTIVIFGNVSPHEDAQSRFFEGALKAAQQKDNSHVAYIYADMDAGEIREYNPSRETEMLLGPLVDDNDHAAPLRVEISFGRHSTSQPKNPGT